MQEDLQHCFKALMTVTLGKCPIGTFTLAMVEPKVYESKVKGLRILPRAISEPTIDPGRTAENNGAPWRGSSAMERSFLFLVYVDARVLVASIL